MAGDKFRLGMASISGLLALAFALASAACSRDEKFAPPAISASNAPPSIEAERVPSFTLVIVKDLQSFTEDCGCSGNNRGGLARVAGAAKGKTKLFILTGESVFAPGQVAKLQTAPSDIELRQAAYQIHALVSYFRHMGSVSLVLNDSETATLKLVEDRIACIADLMPYVVESKPLRTPFGELLLHERGAVLGVGTAIVEYPSASSRARQVLVIDYWEPAQSKSDVSIHRSAELEALLPLTHRSPVAGSRVSALLDDLSKEGRPLLAAYALGLDGAVKIGDSFMQLAVSLKFDRLHSASVAFDPSLFRFEGQAEMVETWKACGACHDEAVQKWSASRHSLAFTTLLARGQSGDSRCTPCHTDNEAARPACFAVTCQSCHAVPGQSVSTDTCRRCHTPTTDPLAEFSGKFKTICIAPCKDKKEASRCKGNRGG